MTGLRGGAYEIVVGPRSTVCRLWAAQTAPPSAGPAALVVVGATTLAEITPGDLRLDELGDERIADPAGRHYVVLRDSSFGVGSRFTLAEIGRRIDESEFATGLLHRIRDCTRRLRLGAPGIDPSSKGLDPKRERPSHSSSSSSGFASV